MCEARNSELHENMTHPGNPKTRPWNGKFKESPPPPPPSSLKPHSANALSQSIGTVETEVVNRRPLRPQPQQVEEPQHPGQASRSGALKQAPSGPSRKESDDGGRAAGEGGEARTVALCRQRSILRRGPLQPLFPSLATSLPPSLSRLCCCVQA